MLENKPGAPLVVDYQYNFDVLSNERNVEMLGIGHIPVTGHSPQMSREKNGFRCFRPGLTQIGLYKHRRWLDA